MLTDKEIKLELIRFLAPAGFLAENLSVAQKIWEFISQETTKEPIVEQLHKEYAVDRAPSE